MNEAKLFKFWLEHAFTPDLQAELSRLEECLQRPYHHMTINTLTGKRDGIEDELRRRRLAQPAERTQT